MARKKIPDNIQKEVLVTSRRRCCICYGLNRDISIKKGQIAHLDGNNENFKFDNLAFLCFDHHDAYDGKTSQSKNYTIKETKEYRSELYSNVLTSINNTNKTDYSEIKKSEIKRLIVEILEDNFGSINSLSFLSYKIGISKNEVEKQLFELSEQKIIRIDRPRGKREKTISLTFSDENIVLDAFTEQLKKEEKINSEIRFVREKHGEIDGIVNTENDNYLIEVKFAKTELNKSILERGIKNLEKFIDKPKYKDYRPVLLIGITKDTTVKNIDLKEFENDRLIIKYIEINKNKPNKKYSAFGK